MLFLWIVTLGWAFSFSLIGVYLSGQVDDFVSVFLRVVLALVVFAPLLWRARPDSRTAGSLMVIGAVQIGLMYLFLFHAYAYLNVPELLLFTIFTPLYVTLIDEVLIGRRHLPGRFWLGAGLAVGGAAIIRFGAVSPDFLTGFCLVQAANLCFAAGQVAYKRLELGPTASQVQTFGLFFAGATLVAGLGVLLFADHARWPTTGLQWGILLWLGLGASGLGYLGWNLGAKRVNTGQLAAMNNMLIPAGILVNFIFWNRDVEWPRLLVGGLVIGLAVWVCREAGHGMEQGGTIRGMEVRLNGETRTFSDNLTVAGVLEELGYDEHGVRVVRNGERVPESLFAEVTINDGDRVEIARDKGRA